MLKAEQIPDEVVKAALEAWKKDTETFHPNAGTIAAAEITRLRAENERLRAALTPSGETKAAYIGEFHFTEETYDDDGVPYYRKIMVPWTTIKEIMAAIRARAAITQEKTNDKA